MTGWPPAVEQTEWPLPRCARRFRFPSGNTTVQIGPEFLIDETNLRIRTLKKRRGSGNDARFKTSLSIGVQHRLATQNWRPYVVVVVDSHIQRIVLATEETTVTQQFSHRPIKCQFCLWSQRGSKVNGSHRRDKPATQPNRDPNRDSKLCDSTSKSNDHYKKVVVYVAPDGTETPSVYNLKW